MQGRDGEGKDVISEKLVILSGRQGGREKGALMIFSFPWIARMEYEWGGDDGGIEREGRAYLFGQLNIPFLPDDLVR